MSVDGNRIINECEDCGYINKRLIAKTTISMTNQSTIVTSPYVIYYCRDCKKNSYRPRAVEESSHKCQICLEKRIKEKIK
jgi:hypothetical protein